MTPKGRWSVCFDETSTQLLAETRPALPPRPGLRRREDYEYRREGTRNLFLACEPLAGWRQVEVTERRTMQDFAQQMRWLVDEAYPGVPVVRLVLDNLNTHRAASLYETFPAAEARRIARRLEFHYTPKHGSWLNMAEIEFSVLSRCCLSQRLPSEEALRRGGPSPGHGAKRRPGRHQLAVQYPGRPNQTSPSLPFRFHG